jgi:hypothetical protein
MKPKYEAVIVVIASQDEDVNNTRYIIKRLIPEWEPLYPVMKSLWEQYAYEEPSFKVIFTYGGGPKRFDIRPHDWIYEDVFENDHPGMITKTLRAFADVERLYDYKYMIRTNLSTFWDFVRLKNRLKTLPQEKCLTGTVIRLQDPSGNSYEYIAGYDLIISRDVVQQILAHTEETIAQRVYCNMEDLSLCTTIAKHTDVRLIDDNRHKAYNFSLNPFDENQYQQHYSRYQKSVHDHFRVKTRQNRNADKEILQHLLYDIYGKTILQSDSPRISV